MNFGLVVLGAHFGFWLTDLIQKYKSDNILLVEPVPYNYRILKEKFSSFQNIYICTNAIYSSNKTDFFTPIFVISRITGWSAHIMEQHAANKLIRPLAKYKGSQHRKVLELNQR